MGFLKGRLAQELQARIQDYIICIEVWYTSMFFLLFFVFVSICAGINGLLLSLFGQYMHDIELPLYFCNHLIN